MSPSSKNVAVLKQKEVEKITQFVYIFVDFALEDFFFFCHSKQTQCRLRTKLYDKRDYFNFPIVNFPFICSNIPAAPAYGVYISQLIRYFRACGSYNDFLERGLLLSRKLLNQGFLLVKLKSSLRKFYGRHHDLADRYGIFVSQMTTLRICSTCRKHFPVLSLFMTYYRICN